MFGWILNILMWLSRMWEKVPDSAKEKIINMIVEAFEDIFREFYRSRKKEQESHNE
ncbi:hypothetical protein [Vreelandella boliviensis]|uniref:hypothetical protein n=1 Tax=Vreelandella boliviensis TaxID=223527 RepID=UPI001B8CC5E5|nr:hypothetical protein [Halomonas boliviensis]MBS3667069.1 hypothetical protein [Halomonas boliviensis]